MIGKPSASAFAAALAALDAEPELTWMVTDDLEQDIRGAQLFGMKTLLAADRASSGPRRSSAPARFRTRCSARSRNVPDWINRAL